MGNGRKKLKVEIFFEYFFGGFKKLLTANLLFAVPSALIFVGYYFLNNVLFGDFNIVFSMTAIILLYPFYAGVVMIVRNIVKGERDFSAVKVYFSAIRHNFLPFLLHGVFVCAASILSYFALTFYTRMLSQTWLMYVLLFFCILIVLLVLYASFYLPLMTLTYDIKLKYLYKNCFLMSFGEIKHNLAATFALLILFVICLTATAFLPSVTLLIIVFSVLWAFLLPSIATFCYTFFIFEGMCDMIENKDAAARDIQDRINARSAKPDKPATQPQQEDFSDIDITKLKDTDDFIFHNGRMIKQSALLKLLQEQEAEKEVERHE